MDFEKEVLQYDGVVLVDFWAPWCNQCKAMFPKLDEAMTELPTAKLVKINVEEHKELIDKYRLSSLPTLMVFNKGECNIMTSGMHTTGQIIGLVKRYGGLE